MILQPVILTPDLVDELVALGESRRPAEACGVVIPYRWRGQQVWEMPNRAKRPHDTFEMHSSDIGVALGEWQEDTQLDWGLITIFHTHPSGSLTPSEADMKHRVPNCGNLLIGLGDPPRATWF